jgi:hypothetical protein
MQVPRGSRREWAWIAKPVFRADILLFQAA